jgi:LacI family transcriptional regulator
VIICQSNESYEREVENTKALLSHRVDGILVSISKNTTDFTHLTDIQESGIPLVFFDRVANGIEADQVIIDDWKPLRATPTIESGCKRIATVRAVNCS